VQRCSWRQAGRRGTTDVTAIPTASQFLPARCRSSRGDPPVRPRCGCRFRSAVRCRSSSDPLCVAGPNLPSCRAHERSGWGRIESLETEMPLGNVLFVTLDQWRGDCLSAAGHPVLRTPNLDRLAARGVRFANHWANAAPCGPSRACLYTGTYLTTNGALLNGTPLDDRLTNVARQGALAGYIPTLFGYTDTAVVTRPAADLGAPPSPVDGVLRASSSRSITPTTILVRGGGGWRPRASTCPPDPPSCTNRTSASLRRPAPSPMGAQPHPCGAHRDGVPRRAVRSVGGAPGRPMVRPPQLHRSASALHHVGGIPRPLLGRPRPDAPSPSRP
jgi:Sulfatase